MRRADRGRGGCHEIEREGEGRRAHHQHRAHAVRGDAFRRASRVLLGAIVLASSPTIAPASITEDDPSWRLESSSDGIALYRGAMPGTTVIPIKAIMTIPGTIEDVSLVLEDIPRRSEWVGNRTRSTLLERTSDYDQAEYLRVNLPWPVMDRSALFRARITVSDDRARVAITAQSIDSHPADTLARLVRARFHASTFQMTQRLHDVEVTTIVCVDPGGSIPKWLVNHFTKRVARSTLVGLRRQVSRKLYAHSEWEAMHRRLVGYAAYRRRQALAPAGGAP